MSIRTYAIARRLVVVLLILSTFMPYLLLGQQSPTSPVAAVIDVKAPIPLWSLLTFTAMWVFTVLRYKLDRRHDRKEQEKDKEDEKEKLKKEIKDECNSFWNDEEFRLRNERKIGEIAERVAGQKIDKKSIGEHKVLATSSDIDLLNKDIEILKLQLKEEMLKEVIILLSRNIVGGIKK